MRLNEILPSQTDMLTMEPEELAGYLLRLFDGPKAQEVHRHNFFLNPELKAIYSEDARKVLMEAWMWLERELMIAPRVDLISGEGMFVTRRGKKLLTEDMSTYVETTKVLPRDMLHPRIEKEAWPNFVRGRYDLAIFAGFRELESEVRRLGKFEPEAVGVDLMRRAFTPKKGPLAPTDRPAAEQEALSHLYAGAIGLYKNPASHRHVGMEAEEAASILLFASHLFSTLESIIITKTATGK